MLKNMTSLREVSILSKEAQKQLKGGDSIGGEMGGGSGTCAVLIPSTAVSANGTLVTYSADHEYNMNGTTILVGISKATVNQFLGQTGVQWCCASCATASWIPR